MEINVSLVSAAAASPSNDWEMWVAISSAAIALCALGTSFWQGYLQRQHNRLSCRPHLTSWVHTEPGVADLHFSVLNNGLGPAKIKDFKILVDGNPLDHPPSEILRAFVDQVLPPIRHEEETGQIVGYTLAAGEERTVLKIHYSDRNHPALDRIDGILKRVKIAITYQDLYGGSFLYEDSLEDNFA